MNIRIQILIVVITLLAMFYVINKIRNKGIELKFSICVQAVKQGEETDTGDGAAGGAEKKSRRRE